MRKRAAIAAATAAALAGSAFALLPAEADYFVRNDVSRCRITETKTQHTIVANSYARVWERHRTVKGQPRIDYYACSNRVRRHFKIASRIGPTVDDPYETVEVSEDSINASFVAFVKGSCAEGIAGPCTYELRQLRLKNGALVRRITAGPGASLRRPIVFGAGQLAYGRSTPDCKPCEVHTVVGDDDRVVDSGNINLYGMGLGADNQNAGTVTWLNGDDARAAVPGGKVYD